MRVALVSPKGPSGAMRSVPHGLMQLCAEAKRAGHEAEIFDFNAHAYDALELKKFDVVGISAMTTQLRHALEIADGLGESVKVVWGGACYDRP